ncbi:hypothetical protein BJ912DRAFT_1147165 [Pholiota molesta]|nr:hypothetical protein BJ912DRAFT_1147165 [Pholiota molesta]
MNTKRPRHGPPHVAIGSRIHIPPALWTLATQKGVDESKETEFKNDSTALFLCTAARPILFPLLNVSTSNPHPDRSVDLKLRTKLDRHGCQVFSMRLHRFSVDPERLNKMELAHNPHPSFRGPRTPNHARLALASDLPHADWPLASHKFSVALNVGPGLPSLVDFPVRPSIPHCALHPYLPPVEIRTHSKARRHSTNSTTSVLFSEQIHCASHRTTKPSAAPSSRKPRPPAPSADSLDVDAS